MKVVIILGLISFLLAYNIDLMVQVKRSTDVSKLNAFAKSKSLTFIPLLPETKVARKRTETIMMLERYYYVTVELKSVEDVQKELLSKDFINAAYVSPKSELPVVKNTPNYQSQQGYLNKSIEGVDMYYARTIPGGKGENVQGML
jgi:hypothetical protein